MNALVQFNPSQLALIKRTVAKDCNDDEFNLFIENCKSLNLDPLRRQIFAFVFSKDNPAKRQMALVTSIAGMRTIADRTGDYRPDEEEPRYETDEALISPANPKGIIKATVKVWKYRHGGWHPVTGEARWHEFAPIRGKGEGATLDTRKSQWGGSKYEPGMPFLMIAKCAEAQALSRAWPDDFANVYVQEATHQSEMIDITPSEAAEQGAQDKRLETLGGGSAVMIDWLDGKELDRVQHGVFADRAIEFIASCKGEPGTVAAWQERNRHSLREFWAAMPTDALEIKRRVEASKAVTSEAAE